MLWKYKKCYQETTEEVTLEPSEICKKIVDISGIYEGGGGDLGTTQVKYILCGDDTNTEVIEELTTINNPLVINKCIKPNSLFIGGVNILNETPTSVPFWTVTADFNTCKSVSIPIESGVISSESNIDSTGVCSFELNSIVWYQNDVAGVLNTGSLVFQNSTGTIPFDGDNEFYRVKATASSDTYFARINAGIIIEIGVC
jgi:hypothetical protein